MHEELDTEGQSKIDPDYLKGVKNKKEREKEIHARAKLSHDDPDAYRPFKTDKTPSGEQRKTKTSKWTKKAAKMGFGPKDEAVELDIEESVLREFINEVMHEIITEKKTNVDKALKNKAEKSGAPLGALRAIYNKGLAAWRTGHRPGASSHQWAMARVNSVLAGGPAREVDAAQWKQIKKARSKKKKK
jgi:hypothetical protein